MAKMRTRLDVADLTLVTELGGGSHGSVHLVESASIPEPMAFKRYLPGVLRNLQAGVLERLVSLAADERDDDRRWVFAHGAWPAATVIDDGVPIGFLMPAAPPPFYRAGDAQLFRVESLLRPPDVLSRGGIEVSDRHRVGVLRDLASMLAWLHGHGAAAGDLSPNDVVIGLEPEPRCFLLACDGVRLRGESVLSQAGTSEWAVPAWLAGGQAQAPGEAPGWSIPAGEERGTASADVYRLGLLTVRLFAHDATLRDARAMPAGYPNLAELARVSLSEYPSRRPSISAWIDAFDQAKSVASSSPRVVSDGIPEQPASPLFESPVSAPPSGAPLFGSPVSGSSVSAAPLFGSPVSGSPASGAPSFGSPGSGSPVSGAPSFAPPPPPPPPPPAYPPPVATSPYGRHVAGQANSALSGPSLSVPALSRSPLSVPSLTFPGGARSTGNRTRVRQTSLIVGAVVAVIAVVLGIGALRSGKNDTSTNSTGFTGGSSTNLTNTNTTNPDTGTPTDMASPVTPSAAPSAQPVDDAATQANALNDLLSRSQSSRQSLTAVLNNVGVCEGLGDAPSVIQSVVSGRTGELASARALAVDALPNGHVMQVVLISALTHSLAADKDYLSWATDVENSGCSRASLNDAHKRAGDTQSRTATVVKQEFLDDWNPIASTYGLPALDQGAI